MPIHLLGTSQEKEKKMNKSNGRRMADTLTTFKTKKKKEPERSNLTPGADPNRKTLDRLTERKFLGKTRKELPL